MDYYSLLILLLLSSEATSDIGDWPFLGSCGSDGVFKPRPVRSTDTETADLADPCFRSRHIALNDSRRSIHVSTYNLRNPDDHRIPYYWYRFVSGAGGTIPTTCPRAYSCSSEHPIWMNGQLPANDGEIHDTQMCANIYKNCTTTVCWYAQVKHCGEYFVYKLPPSPCKYAVYCAGDKHRCDEITTSPTGFEPCAFEKDLPEQPSMPRIWLDDSDHMFFYLVCELSDPNPDILHDVRWVADGNIFYKETLESGQLTARLRESDLYFRSTTVLGYDIHCEVSARKNGIEVGTRFMRSPGYFLGMKFVDIEGSPVNEVVLDEDETKPTFLYVKLTVPVRCNSPSYTNLPEFIRPPCSFNVQVNPIDLQEYHDMLFGDCSREKQISVKDLAGQVAFGYCRFSFTEDNWNNFREHKIPIFGVQDKIFDGRQSRYIQLVVSSIYQRVWEKYIPPLIKVTVEDTKIPKGATTSCTSYNDPHMTTFDGVNYENMKVGEFVLYENIEMNYRVHAYFIKCNNDLASCNCGVAAQAGDDVILFDRCNKFGDLVFDNLPLQASQKGFLRQKVIVRGEMTAGFTLEHRKGTNLHLIKFPHGAELHITVYGHGIEQINLKMIPSQQDYAANDKPQKVQGLCGTFSRDQRDDFRMPDGSVYKLREEDTRGGRHYPDTFSESWKVETGSDRSMYNGAVVDNRNIDSPYKCACLTSGGSDAFQCRFGSECDPDEDKTSTVGRRTMNRRRRRDAGHDHVRDADDILQFNPGSQTDDRPSERWDLPGLSKREARKFCEELFTRHSFYHACREMKQEISFEDDIEICILDIGYVRSTIYATGVLERAMSRCSETFVSDMSLWTVNSAGLPIPDRIKARNLQRKVLTAVQGMAGVQDNPTQDNPIDEFFDRPAISADSLPNQFVFNSICPLACNGRGRCENGKCSCDEGWTGDSCSFERIKPEIYSIPLGGMCDKRLRPCASTPVIGSDFIQSQKLRCIFESNTTDEQILTEPEFESYIELHCPIPAVNATYVLFDVSITNDYSDANMISNSMLLVVFNSQRTSCNRTQCTDLPSAANRQTQQLSSVFVVFIFYFFLF